MISTQLTLTRCLIQLISCLTWGALSCWLTFRASFHQLWACFTYIVHLSVMIVADAGVIRQNPIFISNACLTELRGLACQAAEWAEQASIVGLIITTCAEALTVEAYPMIEVIAYHTWIYFLTVQTMLRTWLAGLVDLHISFSTYASISDVV